MKLSLHLLPWLFFITFSIQAQEVPHHLINIGDSAPPLRVRAWLKGGPVHHFKRDNVYVVEFWATWCGPCKAEMPQLTAMASEYKDKVTFIGVDVFEKKTTSLEKIRAFVDSMGHGMDYEVAAEDSNLG